MKGRLGLQEYSVGIRLEPLLLMKLRCLKHKHRYAATDVLSYPFNAVDIPGQLPNLPPDHPKDLGDIVLCPEFVRRQANYKDLRLRQFMVAALAHGLCHLIGYTHDTQTTAKQVRSLQGYRI